jgi:hypothetical protein
VTTLADIAPRLARAHRERRHELEAQAAEARFRATRLLQAERLLAHRELQLQRSHWTKSPRYIAERQRKLERARAEVARWAAPANHHPKDTAA